MEISDWVIVVVNPGWVMVVETAGWEMVVVTLSWAMMVVETLGWAMMVVETPGWARWNLVHDRGCSLTGCRWPAGSGDNGFSGGHKIAESPFEGHLNVIADCCPLLA